MTDDGEDVSRGLATAIAQLMAPGGAGRERRAEQQLALLPTPAALADALADDEQAQRRGRGRPPGSRNRSTDEWIDFIAARYRSPLLFLAETYNRPVEQLAAEIGGDREEAYKLQMAAARELAPYWHSKQPVAVQISQHGVVELVIETGAPPPEDGADEGLITIEGTFEKGEENQ